MDLHDQRQPLPRLGVGGQLEHPLHLAAIGGAPLDERDRRQLPAVDLGIELREPVHRSVSRDEIEVGGIGERGIDDAELTIGGD